MAYTWIQESVVHAIHDEQIAEHGGAQGTRDSTLLKSALANPQNVLEYSSPIADIAELAACYGYGIANNHPFNDGNKRTAFVVMELFLLMNEYRLVADDASCVLTMLAVAGGGMTKAELAVWIRSHIEEV